MTFSRAGGIIRCHGEGVSIEVDIAVIMAEIRRGEVGPGLLATSLLTKLLCDPSFGAQGHDAFFAWAKELEAT